MTLPITGTAALVLALVFGFIFGVLLHRGRVADYNVIVNQFRLKDFTVLRVMFTAIIVGGIGVLFSFSWVQAHILRVGDLGKLRLSGITGVPDWGWFAILVVIALVVFQLLSRVDRRGAACAK